MWRKKEKRIQGEKNKDNHDFLLYMYNMCYPSDSGGKCITQVRTVNFQLTKFMAYSN